MPGRHAWAYAIAVAVAIAGELDQRLTEQFVLEPLAADPLGFLAGRRYTCYCGRSLVGSILCADCAQEMTNYFIAARRLRPAGGYAEEAGTVA